MAGTTATTTIVVGGVAGVGKTTVMGGLVARLGWASLEGDALHPEANVEKMRAGIRLTHDDRRPWLAAIGAWIGDREARGEDAVVTCSALRRRYRDALRAGNPSVWFAMLEAPRSMLETRIADRRGHFMPADLLASQLDTLEGLEADERGRHIDASGSPADVVARIVAAVVADTGGRATGRSGA